MAFASRDVRYTQLPDGSRVPSLPRAGVDQATRGRGRGRGGPQRGRGTRHTAGRGASRGARQDIRPHTGRGRGRGDLVATQPTPSGRHPVHYNLVSTSNQHEGLPLMLVGGGPSDDEVADTFPIHKDVDGKDYLVVSVPIKSRVCCTVCSKTFSGGQTSKLSLPRHLLNVHGISAYVTYKCKLCDYKPDPNKRYHLKCINTHVRESHQVGSPTAAGGLPCEMCDRVFPSALGLRNHIRSHNKKPHASVKPQADEALADLGSFSEMGKNTKLATH